MVFDERKFEEWLSLVRKDPSTKKDFQVFGEKMVVVTNGEYLRSFSPEEMGDGLELLRKYAAPPTLKEKQILDWENLFFEGQHDIPITKTYRNTIENNEGKNEKINEKLIGQGKNPVMRDVITFESEQGAYNYSPFYMQSLQILGPCDWMLIPHKLNGIMLLVGITDRIIGAMAPIATPNQDEERRGPVHDDLVHAAKDAQLHRGRSPRTVGKEQQGGPSRRSPSVNKRVLRKEGTGSGKHSK